MARFKTNGDYFRYFAEVAGSGGSPLYETLSLGIAEDEKLQALAAGCRPGQPAANVLFAAVHFLLLGGMGDPLAAYYPSVGGTRPADEGAVHAFKAFCAANAAALKRLIANGVTNTNEVGRSAFLAPGLALVSARTGLPLALIEVGPSAGLNLNFHLYGYRYTDENGTDRLERWAGRGVTLTCVMKSQALPPLPEAPPAVAGALGLELNRVDMSREEDRRWLKALVWPERTDRLARLEAALGVARDHPPPVREGEALALLPQAIAESPSGAALCVFHSFVLYQFSREMRTAFDAVLAEQSMKRPIWRLWCEGETDGAHPLRLRRYARGEVESEETLADCSPHGHWLDWHGRLP